MEEYLEEAKKLGLVLYQPCHEYDVALLQWWMHLNETGDFEDLFAQSQRPLSKFLKIFEPPCMLALAFEDTKIWAAMWFTPVGDGASAAFVGYWCDKDKRGSRKQFAITKLLYTMAFNFWAVLVGVTKHERLLRIHRKLGYNIVGSIPSFMEGDDAWIVYLNKENFEKSRMYKLGEK
ncbi:MAG: hypothetical protein ACXABY_15690 [Candidatus Thorarchaeota archaeon]|jgi:hypothetical protein